MASEAATRAARTKARAEARGDARRPTRRDRVAAKRADRLRKMRTRAGSRYWVHYDIDGPRVRLGVAWFVGAVIALAAGTFVVAAYFGVAFAAAASHGARTWQARKVPVDPRVALVGTALVVVAAAFGARTMGAVLLAVVAGFVLLELRAAAASPRSPASILGPVGDLLRVSLAPAVAGGCLVVLQRAEPWSAASLVLLVSAYECGDFLIGSGSSNRYEGPLAGGVAVLVVAMAVAALGFPPFTVVEAIVFGVSVFPAAVGGQFVASMMLPHARALAPALRRVDSMLLAAPGWYLGLTYLL